MPIVSQEECIRSNSKFLPITSTSTFCAGDRSGKAPCTGDSGGGFVMKRSDNRFYLRGVVSTALKDGPLLCDVNNYVVFADVSKFSEWINQTMNIDL